MAVWSHDEARRARALRVGSKESAPATIKNETNGFIVYLIRPHSLAKRLGFENGDIIITIAGRPLVTADKALEIYQTLREAKPGDTVVVELERRGNPVTFTYTLK